MSYRDASVLAFMSIFLVDDTVLCREMLVAHLSTGVSRVLGEGAREERNLM